MTKYNKLYRFGKSFLSFGIACFLIFFLVIKFYQHYDTFVEQKIFLSPFTLSLSFFPLIISYFFIPFIWIMILKSLDSNITYRNAFQIQYISHLGKYIPSKIWSYVMQSYYAKKINISIKTTLVSNIILMAIMSISNIILFSLSFLLWNTFYILFRFVVLFICFLLMYVFFMTNIFELIMNFILKNILHFNIDFQYEKINKTYLSLFIVTDWILFSLGIFFMINSFYNINIIKSFIVVGTFSISWIIGYYSFISPGGLGIQESVQVYLFNFFFPLPVSIIIALASRLWMIVGDLCVSLLALGSLVYERRGQKPSQAASYTPTRY